MLFDSSVLCRKYNEYVLELEICADRAHTQKQDINDAPAPRAEIGIA